MKQETTKQTRHRLRKRTARRAKARTRPGVSTQPAYRITGKPLKAYQERLKHPAGPHGWS